MVSATEASGMLVSMLSMMLMVFIYMRIGWGANSECNECG